MSRIPLSPGVKERVSANVGRLLANTWAYNDYAAQPRMVEDALSLALAIEEAVTEALAVETATKEDK